MRIECFISYAREDTKLAHQLIELLQGEGIECWWDEKISPGKNYIKEINKAIENCQCFLVIWTPRSILADYVLSERRFIQETENGDEKVVSIAIGKSLKIGSPFNLRNALKISLGKNETLEEEDSQKILDEVKSKIGIIGKKEHIIHPRALGEPWEYWDLAIEGPVPGTNILSSFRPCGQSGVFLIMRFNTTDGWVDNNIHTASRRHQLFSKDPEAEYQDGENKFLKIRNDVLFIKDPIRPYSIQIGGIRSERPNAQPGIIEAKITKDTLDYLQMRLPWLSLTLAEILTDEGSLKELSNTIDSYIESYSKSLSEEGLREEQSREIKEKINEFKKVSSAISRNPFAPLEIQKSSCRFCDQDFKEKRCLTKNNGATLIANDFPFGPSFHYVVILNEPVHSWEDIEYKHLLDLNILTQKYLSSEGNRFGAAGVEYGFNSSVRHLVLGRKTHSSAGASIPHIHKQVWGMVPNTTNLADHLITVSSAYSNIGIDYQKQYIKALREADYVLWEDENVVLYVPYGQISTHELQIMMKREFGSYIDFNAAEIESLSVAEFMVFRIYKELGITSFNSIFLSKLFEETKAPHFRVVQIFLTREVDLAVSELSTLYVVDQHPSESMQHIKTIFNGVIKARKMRKVIDDYAHFADESEPMETLYFINALPRSHGD
jgi:galactose-1-phosphate uridylyltransferase